MEERFAVGSEPLVLGTGTSSSAERLGQAERLEEPHDLVIEMDRARQPVDLGEALKRGHAMAGPPEQRRERLAHRAVPDDRHVDVDVVVRGSRARHQISLQ